MFEIYPTRARPPSAVEIVVVVTSELQQQFVFSVSVTQGQNLCREQVEREKIREESNSPQIKSGNFLANGIDSRQMEIFQEREQNNSRTREILF